MGKPSQSTEREQDSQKGLQKNNQLKELVQEVENSKVGDSHHPEFTLKTNEMEGTHHHIKMRKL